MRTFPPLALASCLLAAALLLGCGDDAPLADGPGSKDGGTPTERPSTPPRPPQHWHAEIPDPPRVPGSRKEYVQLDVPEAFGARPLDTKASLTLNVLPNGDVHFRGKVWPLGVGTPEERQAGLDALRTELAQAVTGTYGRRADGTSQAPLILHADRRVPWAVIAALLPVVLDPKMGFPAVYFSAFRPPNGWEHVIGGTWSPLSSATREKGEVLPVKIGATEGDGGTTLTIRVAANRWSLPRHADSFEDKAFVSGMNRTWMAIADWLAQNTLDGKVIVDIEIPEGGAALWLAHVVKMIDLLKTAGVRDIAFVTEDLRLEIEGL